MENLHHVSPFVVQPDTALNVTYCINDATAYCIAITKRVRKTKASHRLGRVERRNAQFEQKVTLEQNILDRQLASQAALKIITVHNLWKAFSAAKLTPLLMRQNHHRLPGPKIVKGLISHRLSGDGKQRIINNRYIIYIHLERSSPITGTEGCPLQVTATSRRSIP
jgi:hypothetical protein